MLNPVQVRAIMEGMATFLARGRQYHVIWGEGGRPVTEPPPTAHAGNPPMFLGTLLTPTIGENGPGAEAEESYGTTSGYQDWYNDFQSSDSVDSYYPTERPSLILALLHRSTRREEPAGRFWGGPIYASGLDSAEPYGDQLDYENRHSEVDSAESYDPCLDDY
ncbi:hypothetical protein P4O66_000536 [Electrophorus voltai]|uniref:Uncharacterized protein n=1 Tax=Electrophorus voltai TaxID=2609070 RepID=A0AAD8ZHB6_9TELE|nr:hypothetical protein P4O66_000536 [Electrophorus voltai]